MVNWTAVPCTVVEHVTGPFTRLAFVPEMLNWYVQPACDEYERSVPEPLFNGTVTLLFPLTGCWPGQVMVVVSVVLGQLPRKFCTFLLPLVSLPPQARASAKRIPLITRVIVNPPPRTR